MHDITFTVFPSDRLTLSASILWLPGITSQMNELFWGGPKLIQYFCGTATFHEFIYKSNQFHSQLFLLKKELHIVWKWCKNRQQTSYWGTREQISDRSWVMGNVIHSVLSHSKSLGIHTHTFKFCYVVVIKSHFSSRISLGPAQSLSKHLKFKHHAFSKATMRRPGRRDRTLMSPAQTT